MYPLPGSLRYSHPPRVSVRNVVRSEPFGRYLVICQAKVDNKSIVMGGVLKHAKNPVLVHRPVCCVACLLSCHACWPHPPPRRPSTEPNSRNVGHARCEHTHYDCRQYTAGQYSVHYVPHIRNTPGFLLLHRDFGPRSKKGGTTPTGNTE